MEKRIGVYIGKKEIVAVSLALNRNIPQINLFAIEPIETPIEPAKSPDSKTKKKHKELSPEAAALKKALTKIGALKSHAIAAFSSFHIATRFFQMPFIPKKEWSETIKYEVTKYIPFKLEEIVSDFSVKEAKIDDKDFLLVTTAAVKSEQLEIYVNTLRDAGAKVDMLEPVFSAGARAIGYVEKDLEQGAFGLIFIDSDGSVNITISSEGVVYLSRDFLMGENQSDNQTRFYQELKASTDYMNRIPQAKELKRIFLSGSGDLFLWSSFLQSVFQKQYSFQVASFPSEKEIPKNILSMLIVPIGLALKGFDMKSPLGDFMLLPPENRRVRPQHLVKLLEVEFLIAAVVFALIYFAVLIPYRNSIQNRLISQLSPEAARDTELAKETYDNLKIMKQDLETQISQMSGFSKGKVSLKVVLQHITADFPKSMWLENIRYGTSADLTSGQGQSNPSGAGENFAAKKPGLVVEGLSFSGNAEKEVQEINKWVKSLNEDKVLTKQFKSINLEDVRRDRANDYDLTRFKITCR